MGQPWEGRFAPPGAFLGPVAPPPPPRKRIGLRVALAAALLAFLGSVVWLVVETTSGPRRPAAVRETSATKLVESSDGRSRITVPEPWVDLPEEYRSPDSVISQGQIYQGRYVMVITDELGSFGDFAEYEEMAVRGMADIVDGAVVGQPREVSVGDLPGVRYEVGGAAQGEEVVFWFTLVEGRLGYHQVITWTPAERRGEAERPLHEVAGTFRETG